jgi:hypothetical protein
MADGKSEPGKARKRQVRCAIVFSPSWFSGYDRSAKDRDQRAYHDKQKEAVFNALIKNHLLSTGFFVATPEPDLGDDLWFVQSSDMCVQRGQIKSAHTCTIFRNDPGGPRQFNTRLQLDTLHKWVDRPGFSYFFGLADERLSGLGTGVTRLRDRCFEMSVDESNTNRNPQPIREMEPRETGTTFVRQFRAVTNGFHFGVVPAEFFGVLIRKQKESVPIWITVETSPMEGTEPSPQAPHVFRYSIYGKDVTCYFGNLTFGLQPNMHPS